MPSDFLQSFFDPTAPLPAFWPGGFWGAFLLFCIPIGGGIPLGVLMARDAGVSPAMMAVMYFVSDIFMAVTHEPFFWLSGWARRARRSYGWSAGWPAWCRSSGRSATSPRRRPTRPACGMGVGAARSG